MEALVFLAGLLIGVVGGIFVARNNAKRIQAEFDALQAKADEWKAKAESVKDTFDEIKSRF